MNTTTASSVNAAIHLGMIDAKPNGATSEYASSMSVSNIEEAKKKPSASSSKLSSLPQNKTLSVFTISIISLSAEPLTGQEIIENIEFRCNEVVTRFLPCVEFLVACQQELRQGLSSVMQKGGRGRSVFSATQEVIVSYLFLFLSLYFIKRTYHYLSFYCFWTSLVHTTSLKLTYSFPCHILVL